MLIQTPPQFGGDERQQLVQVRSYLYQLAETLNQNLNNLSLDNFRPDAKQTITAVAEDSEKTIQQNAQALKALIVKTAAVIEAQIDEISTELETDYVAKSEFGTYTKQAFSKAGKKINPSAYFAIFKESVEIFYKDGDCKRFKGYRVTAIDGTKYNMPNSEEMKKVYGFQGSTNEQPQALGSCLYDVLNGMCEAGINIKVIQDTLGHKAKGH